MNMLMRATLITFAIFVLCACQATNNAPNQTASVKPVLNYAQAQRDYAALVLKIQQGQASQRDFDNIVRIYPLTRGYDPYTGIEQAKRLVASQAMDEADWQRCLMATQAILQANYTSITGHHGAMLCSYEAGFTAQGQHHERTLQGFMEAVWRSGDGQRPESAFYITSANDLYAFIQLQNHIAVGQSLVYLDERPIHAMSVRNLKNQKESVWYFDVTAQFRRGMLDKIERS